MAVAAAAAAAERPIPREMGRGGMRGSPLRKWCHHGGGKGSLGKGLGSVAQMRLAMPERSAVVSDAAEQTGGKRERECACCCSSRRPHTSTAATDPASAASRLRFPTVPRRPVPPSDPVLTCVRSRRPPPSSSSSISSASRRGHCARCSAPI